MEKESGSIRDASRFQDRNGREKRITLVHDSIGKELLQAMNIGDALSMAYFWSEPDALDGGYIFLYDHARHKEYSFAEIAFSDLYWATEKSGWLDDWRARKFGKTDQYNRILGLAQQRS